MSDLQFNKPVLEKAVTIEEAKPFIVVGIPAFNEERTIARIVLEAQKYADKVIVCDDGSTDMTAEIAERLGAAVIKHETNKGYGAAINSLFKHARKLDADVLVTLDGDGQHDPSEIPMVIKPLLENRADIVIGSRFVKEENVSNGMPWYRKLGVKVITKLTNAASKHYVKDAQSGFRAYNNQSLKKLNTLENGMGVSVEILLEAKKKGLRIHEVPAKCNYNDIQSSTYNPLRHGIDVIMSIIKLVVEEKPLVLLGIPGILFLILGTIFGVWMLQIYATEKQIITNIALASIAFTLMGFFALSTAITLYAISRLAEKINNK
jgi:glycosyltransferase involved in cell wall biosynthesis